MKKYISFLIILFACCTDPYELATKVSERLLVVDGYIGDKVKTSEINLSYSDEFETKVFQKVTNAKVEIVENSSVIHPFIEGSPGLYIPSDTLFKADFHNIYKLHIEIDDKLYESDEVCVKKSAGIDSLSFEAVTKYRAGDKVEYRALDILVNTETDEDASRYYRYFAEETWLVVAPTSLGTIYYPELTYEGGKPVDVTWTVKYDQMSNCWPSFFYKGINTATTEGLTRNQLVGMPIFAVSLNGPKLLYKYSVQIKQYSIPKVAYNFLSLIQVFIEQSGSLFDVQPGFIRGNVKCLNDENEKVLGIFYASNITEKRMFIHYTDLAFPDRAIVDNYRLDCLNETLIIPFTMGADKTKALLFMNDSILAKGLVPINIIPDSINLEDIVGFTSILCADCRYAGTNIKPEWWGKPY